MNDFIAWIRQNKWEECLRAQQVLLQSLSPETCPLFPDAEFREALDVTLSLLSNANEAPQTSHLQDALWDRVAPPRLPRLNSFFSAQQGAIATFLPHYFSQAQDLWNASEEITAYFRKVHAQLIAKETTAQGAVQQRIAESEERYRDLFDNAHDLIHIVATGGEILYVNNAWERALGYREDQIRGSSIYTFVHDTDRHLFTGYREKVLSGRAPAGKIVLRLVSQAGQVIYVEGSLTARHNGAEPAYTRGIFRDITDRVADEKKLQHANKLLKEREENLQHLIRYAPDAIIVIDAESFISLWNPKAEQVFGWREGEVVEKPLAEIIIPERYRAAHTAGMRRYLATGEAVVLNKTIEVMARHRDGHEFEISLTISHYTLGGKNFFISFVRDLHLQRKNERELEQKRKEVEESNHELEQYAWLASHDLREPLRKILTYSDLILTRHRPSLNAETSEYLRKIHTSACRMGGLINALLLYSSIAHEHYAYTRVSLGETVSDVLIDLELMIRETGATIEAGPLPVIDAIPHQLAQLFQNLISNALKYCKAGLPPEVKIASVEDGTGNVVVTVEDNGIGFESGDQDVIFQLFRRLPGHNKEGSGVGLALCKKIVQNHNGSITVESEPGMGAKFSICLPTVQ